MNPQQTIDVILGLFEEKNILLEHCTQYAPMLQVSSVANNNMMDDIVTLLLLLFFGAIQPRVSQRLCRKNETGLQCYAMLK